MTATEHLPDLDGAPHANVSPGAEPKTIRLALAADERVDPHTHPGRDVVLYLVEGTIDLDDEQHSLEAGDVARFAGEREVSPVAREPSTALIVLAERSRERSAPLRDPLGAAGPRSRSVDGRLTPNSSTSRPSRPRRPEATPPTGGSRRPCPAPSIRRVPRATIRSSVRTSRERPRRRRSRRQPPAVRWRRPRRETCRVWPEPGR